MNSRAGSGEYSSTSTGPEPVRERGDRAAQRVGVADVRGGAGRGDPIRLQLPGELVQPRLRARDQAHREALAPEAPRDRHPQVRPRSDDHDRHAATL